jgi:hypothetical protein
MSGKDPQRRFIDLEVDEVSLVGSPANEVPFLVTKSKRKPEDSSMVAKAEKTEDSQTVQVEQTSEASAEVVRKCLKSVENIVKNVITMKGEELPAVESIDVTKGITVSDLLTKAGMEGDVLKSALGALAKAGVDTTKMLSAPAAVETTKAVETPKAQTSEDVMEVFAQVIQKAARLTPARVKQLQDAQELLKLVLEGVSVGESPKTKTPDGQNPGSGIQTQLAKAAEPTEVTKSLVAITEGMTQISTVLKGLSERMESLEKAKPASSSDAPNTTDTKKAKGASLFAGVI